MGFLRKYIFPILFGVIFFSLFKNHLPKFKVLSALETIDLLKKNDKLSLVRFGDGEFDIIAQKREPNYQRTSPRLREALLKILNSRSICVAVPEALSVDVLTPENSTNSHLEILENLCRLESSAVPPHSRFNPFVWGCLRFKTLYQ